MKMALTELTEHLMVCLRQGKKMANSQLGKLTESILRNMVSNLTIQEVLTERESLRDSAKEKLIDITKGWGIWIETVEITDVRISSSSLFSNLQAEFRQKTRLEAEQIQMNTEKTLNDARRANAVETQQSQELAETRKYEIQQGQQVAREQRQFQTKQEQHKIKLQEMEQNKEYKLNRTRTDNEVSQATELANQELSTIKQVYEIAKKGKDKEHERQMKQLELEMDNNLTPTNLKVRMMSILDKAVGQINYNMKVVNMGNNDSLANMIPGMAQMWKETMEN